MKIDIPQFTHNFYIYNFDGVEIYLHIVIKLNLD